MDAQDFKQARWDLLPPNSYMWASVQTVRGCAKHCSFCSVWRTDGQKPRQRGSDSVIEEIVELRRRGFRFIALADDNFYPVTFTDIALAKKQKNEARVNQLETMREERFEFMERSVRIAQRYELLHANHHGGGGRHQISGRHEESPDQRSAGGRGGRHPRRIEGGLSRISIFPAIA